MTNSRGIKFILNSPFSSTYCLDGQLTSILKIIQELTFASRCTPKTLQKEKKYENNSSGACSLSSRGGVRTHTCSTFLKKFFSRPSFPVGRSVCFSGGLIQTFKYVGRNAFCFCFYCCFSFSCVSRTYFSYQEFYKDHRILRL